MPLWARDTLRQGGVSFRETHHPREFTSQRVAAAEHVSGHRLIKVVVVMADDRPIELILPATRRVRLEQVKQLLGAQKVRLASESEMGQIFPDCEVGAIPPLAQRPGVPMIMDQALDEEGEIVMQAGTHEDSIRMNYRDWFALARPRIASFAEQLH
jgi:Ala-tRNA(Pro) deacylase